jgi:hypothetical protein
MMKEVSGRKVCVCNFGCANYYSTQERILFEQLLASGLRPDIAIFMEGLNEFANNPDTFFPAIQTAPSLGERISKLYEALPLYHLTIALKRRFVKETDAPTADASWQTNAPDSLLIEATLVRYMANKKMITAVAYAFGVTPAFLWQPVPVYQYDLSLHPFTKPGRPGPLITQPGYQRAAEYIHIGAWGRNFIWCAHIQANAREPLYVDKWHCTAKFSREVAGCILQGLQEQLLSIVKH